MDAMLLTFVILLCSISLFSVDSEPPDSHATPADAQKQAHQFFAANCNNKTWELMEKTKFSDAERDSILQNAFASAYHWQQIGTGINFQRAAWLIARVYTVLENKQEALSYAQRCLDLTKMYSDELQNFDRAYAFEAVARAYALNHQSKEYKKYYALAEKAGNGIKEKEDKDLFMNDLLGGNWFGMK